MLDSFAYVWCVLGEPFEEQAALTSLDTVFLRTLGIADDPPPRRRAPARARSRAQKP
jgi:hypothetical protein